MPKYRSDNVQMLGISHSGVRLIKRNQTKTDNDTLQVLETITFDLVQDISMARTSSTLDIHLPKKHMIIHSHRV
jgi:hypothetical protein